MTTNPSNDDRDAPSVAIVGAGMAGSVCAMRLRETGLAVRAFDKGRGPGGRMATRRAEVAGDGEVQFDHGAQYFTARDERFRDTVEQWREAGVVERWAPELVVLKEGDVEPKSGGPTRYVGIPKMSAVVGHLADTARPEFEVRVETIERAGGDWRLEAAGGDDLGTYDGLVVTAPAEQSAELLAGVDSPIRDTLRSVSMEPTWSVMLAFEDRLPVDFDAAFVHDSSLSWIARNSAKPGRPDHECWILHSSHEWARDHLERPAEGIAESLTGEFLDQLGLAAPPALSYRRAHRWRYAAADPPLEQGALWDAERRLAVAGDWVDGSRVEGAFLSGRAAADCVSSKVATE